MINRNGFDFYLRIMGHGFSRICTDFIFIHRRDRGGRREKQIIGWLPTSLFELRRDKTPDKPKLIKKNSLSPALADVTSAS